MRSSLIHFIILLILCGCTKNQTDTDHLDNVTLKLLKPISISLTNYGNSPSLFNITALLEYPEPILNADIKWILLDADDKKILEKSDKFEGEGKKLQFNSGEIEVLNPGLNHKVVFIFSGKTRSDEVNKTEIFNTLIQSDLDQAIENLKNRAKTN